MRKCCKIVVETRLFQESVKKNKFTVCNLHTHIERSIAVNPTTLQCANVYRKFACFLQRIQMLCRPDPAWGPALDKNWNYVEYFPAVQTNLLAVEMENPPLNTITGENHSALYS